MAVGAILGQRGIQSVNGVFSNTDGNVDLSTGNMTSGINMNNKELTGLKEPTNETDATNKTYVDTAATTALRFAAPSNLLDNSYFRYPVAQAGIGGNHGNQAYAVDRWILTNGSVSHQPGVGLTLNGTITQRLENIPFGAVSAFVGMASGNASISHSSGIVTITSSGGVIAWAALYQGTYTEESMPEYRPKGYGVELTECQRYYIRLAGNNAALTMPGHITSGAATAIGILFIPNPMRIAATATFTGKITIRGINGYSTGADAGGYANPNISSYNFNKNVCAMQFTKTDGGVWENLENNTPISISVVANSVLELNADL